MKNFVENIISYISKNKFDITTPNAPILKTLKFLEDQKQYILNICIIKIGLNKPMSVIKSVRIIRKTNDLLLFNILKPVIHFLNFICTPSKT